MFSVIVWWDGWIRHEVTQYPAGRRIAFPRQPAQEKDPIISPALHGVAPTQWALASGSAAGPRKPVSHRVVSVLAQRQKASRSPVGQHRRSGM